MLNYLYNFYVRTIIVLAVLIGIAMVWLSLILFPIAYPLFGISFNNVVDWTVDTVFDLKKLLR